MFVSTSCHECRATRRFGPTGWHGKINPAKRLHYILQHFLLSSQGDTLSGNGLKKDTNSDADDKISTVVCAIY